MPTPASFATAAMGAPGSVTNTARAAARIRSSFRAACARRPLVSTTWPRIAERIVPFCYTDRNRTFRSPTEGSSAMDMKLELVAVPVSDVDRAKAFYEQAGFHADHDHRVSDDLRFVQMTPPGSACSIAFGDGITDAEPGSLRGLQVVVDDAEATRALLVEQGIDAQAVQEFPWGRFTFFADPDGNGWAVQEIQRPAA